METGTYLRCMSTLVIGDTGLPFIPVPEEVRFKEECLLNTVE
ncbi:hypothetical protein [Methanogenium organophilum]|uniref:Uncharacterized protein n=1 Tax=Methanogenium organophilum TaxID=2199 RepID=A0A9X9T8G5_METOG|nr:hypothetical protein [Methanogenium organophilum]WAI01421.1 hypothetical protein OU421_00675 [Methanogenium organophilum]